MSHHNKIRQNSKENHLNEKNHTQNWDPLPRDASANIMKNYFKSLKLYKFSIVLKQFFTNYKKFTPMI
jgi:hypothetical protein